MTRDEYTPILEAKYPDITTFAEIDHTFRRIIEYFSTHEKISISISGGSDSDTIVHIVCKYFPEFLHKCVWVFADTGLEYEATRRHLKDLEKAYGIKIERVFGLHVGKVVNTRGLPILSKIKSKTIHYYCKGSLWAEKRIFPERFADAGKWSLSVYTKFSNQQKALAEHCKKNGIVVSAACCELSKKKPITDFEKSINADLVVTGERKAEGGQRGLQESCFHIKKSGLAKFMPLFAWSDETKRQYKQAEGIRYSDCYEVWGMTRTGCTCCPFAPDVAKNLELTAQYEPNRYKAAMAIFGDAYRLTDQFHAKRKKCIPEEMQFRLFDI